MIKFDLGAGAVLGVCLAVPALATTYTITPGASTASIQGILNTAGTSPGNTVLFSAGAYTLTNTLMLPCSNGTVYTGPNVGIVTPTNFPTAMMTSTVPTNYAVATDSNGTAFTGAQGCTIEYLRFTGTQGGILVYSPASGITIQENAFDNNNPPAGGGSSQANIYVTGDNWLFTPASGVTHLTIVWNTFVNNCAAIRATAWPDSGGGCAATWVNGYNNYLTWSDNTINLTEEGLKLSVATADGIASLNAKVENNNMQGNSRILIESQQDTNGASDYSHNAFYQPYNPSFNTYELSIPEWSTSISPTHTATDNVFIGNVPITIGGSGGHYGIGLELWGAGSIATHNLFQGGNGPDTCSAGWSCSSWGVTLGEAYSNANITNNYFSGTGVWAGNGTDVSNAVTYEDGASAGNRALVLSPNTVVQTSAPLPTAAPVISAQGSTVTLSAGSPDHTVSMFYTTDGTTPAPFGPGGRAGTSKVYTGPFTAAGGTVKVIASWGQGANQGIKFPSFGYVPSPVVTATVSGTPAGAALVSAYLSAKGNANTMVNGSTLQFTGYGVYSDGSVKRLPSAQGDAVTGWNTTNHAVAKISSQGHVTALGSGKVDIQAMVGKVPTSRWTITVGTAAQAAAANVAAPANATQAARATPQAVGASHTTAADTQGGEMPASSVPSSSGGSSPEPAPVAPTAPVPAAPVTTGPVPAGPIPAAAGNALPDTFNGPFWTLVAPAGGSGSISESHLFLGVPGGSNHDALVASNHAVRVVQATHNEDFDVAIKVDSALYASDAGTSQGLMVLADDKNFVTFAMTTDGTRVGLNAHTMHQGAATTVLDDRDFSQYQNPMYLRLAKTGDAYVAYYSTDGVVWTQATRFTDMHAASFVGPFASNYNETPAKTVPVVMSVNWFEVQ